MDDIGAKVHKPDIIGPGVWCIIHSYGYNATDEPSKKRFKEFIEYLSENFPCKKCRKHLAKYAIDHPLKDCWNMKDGLFKWSWEMHNVLNKYLKKSQLDFETAYKIADPNYDCDSCSIDSKDEKKEEPSYPPLSFFIARVNSPTDHINKTEEEDEKPKDVIFPVMKLKASNV
jgi:hypothetical protein